MSLYFLHCWLQITTISSQRWNSSPRYPKLPFSTTTGVCGQFVLLFQQVSLTSLPVYQKCKHLLKHDINSNGKYTSFKQQLCRKQHLMLIPVDNLRSKISKLPSLCSSAGQKKDCRQHLTHHSFQILPPVSTSAVPIDWEGKWTLHPLPTSLS